ncbi:cytochrome c class I [Fibrella aestuarina BUZ 2]|uniref:Cytochrome c class I n=1 Tax=Fibrella aestuarina BUZ 2 TaxID=1166018 RepID=I0K227_9BACT|nr:PQQ-dependent sugar dehydrogenase [Fibrella aestuarina]CCG98180.1 cytochrome c class I [Fibrella aestuarina BUZ 2]
MIHSPSSTLLSAVRLIGFLVILALLASPSFAQTVANGETLFEAKCASCHNFKQDGIGPQLGGLKGVVDAQYLDQFIKSPKAMIDSRVARAYDKFRKFRTVMPNFNYLEQREIDQLVAYILKQPAPASSDLALKNTVENPVGPAIAQSGLVLKLEKVIQFPATRKTDPLTRVNKVGVHPITKETLVADLQGQLYILNSQHQADVYVDATVQFPNFVNEPGLATGLGSFAFHPDFAKNGLFYTTHTEPKNAAKADFAFADSIPVKLQWVVDEWTVDKPAARVMTGKRREVLRVNVVGQIHGMQEIAFNPYAKPGTEDYGLLYIGIGDGGAVEQGYPFIPREKNHVWGKVLRINPAGRTSRNGQYGIPPTNPYVGKDGLDEVYASGFRNPNRISWTKDGKMLVSNIGQRQLESLYWVKRGKNYGWPDREGTFAIESMTNINVVSRLPKDDAAYGYSYPIAQFDHDEGNAIMGGFEYTGKQVPALKGKYVFGEVVRGRVFYINLSEVKEGKQATIHELALALDGKPTTLKALTKADKVDFRIGQDASGELYVLTKSDGMMYKVVP